MLYVEQTKMPIIRHFNFDPELEDIVLGVETPHPFFNASLTCGAGSPKCETKLDWFRKVLKNIVTCFSIDDLISKMRSYRVTGKFSGN